jgi:hypothetical protein
VTHRLLVLLALLDLPRALAAPAAPALAAPTAAAPDPAATDPRSATAPAATSRRSPKELTFIVTADTHIGALGMEQANRKIVDQMNRLPGTPWPAPFGGRVGKPRGVIVAGDLTNSGSAREWKLFASLPLRGHGQP